MIQIDWQKVADDLGISNGHAARMRFSRFKTQMEGSQALIRRTKPPAKHPRSTVKKDKGVKEESKGGKPIVKEDKGADTEEDQKVKIAIKMEDEDPTDSMEDIEFATDGSESVKMEPNEAVEQYSRDLLQIKPEPLDDLILLDQDPAQLRSIPLVIKSEPFVKEEVEYGGPAFGQ